MANKFVLLEDKFLDAEVFGHAPKGDSLDEFFGWSGYRTETVYESFAVTVEFLVGGEVVKFFVEQETFADAGDITVGKQYFEVGFYDAFLDIGFVLFDFLLEEVVEFGFF